VVYSFEPLPANIADLKNHISLNNINNIKIIESAISNKDDFLSFKLATHGGQGSLIGIGRESGDTLEVKTTTLDNFCTTHNILPDFIKIDIEGAEGLALEGFSKKVKESYPFFAIDLHTPECDIAVGKFFSEHGYEAFRVINSYVKGEHTNRIEKILLLNEPYPHPQGIWGVVWAVHPSRKHQVAEFIKKYT
jgi:FkbM family methyltransferase